MTTFIIFIILGLAEFVFVWFEFQRIKDLADVGNMVGNVATNVVGVNEKYKGFISWLAGKFIKMKSLVWIPITITLFCNLIAAIILSFIFGIIIETIKIVCQSF